MMNYRMTPEEYLEKVLDLYIESRKSKFNCPCTDITRGRSSSISSGLEDLTAYFLALNVGEDRKFFVDQPMRFGTKESGKIQTRYPDIAIVEKGGIISHLVEVKTDLGWMRDGMSDFCEDWDTRIERVKGTETSFKYGDPKKEFNGRFSTDLKYHIVVVAKGNYTGLAKIKDFNKDFNNVLLYFLLEKLHPNFYGMTKSVAMEKIEICHSEFDLLITNINARN